MTNAISQASWFSIMFLLSQNETNSKYSSRLEPAFLSESGASVSVLNIPTYILINRLFKVRNYDQHDTSKTLTIANQSEVPSKQYIYLNCFSKKTKIRYFKIPFAVSDIEYFILGTPF